MKPNTISGMAAPAHLTMNQHRTCSE